MEKVLIEDGKGGTGVLPYLPLDKLRKDSSATDKSEPTGGQR
jgi:hypothetical protein